MKFLDPKNDIAFKKIFGNEHHKNKTIHQLETLTDKWFYFFKYATTLKFVPDSLQDLQEAFNILDTLKWNDADLQDYSLKQEAIDRERRQQEGSKLEGKFEEKESIAINLLKEGLSIQIIVKATGLSIDQIEALKNKLK